MANYGKVGAVLWKPMREPWAFVALQTLYDTTPNCKLGLVGGRYALCLSLFGNWKKKEGKGGTCSWHLAFIAL